MTIVKKRNTKRSTTEEFICKAIEIHGDKYDYSKVEYINSHIKVCIICNRCGREFWQMPYDHLNGKGCKYCNESKLEKNARNFFKEKKKH